MCNLLMTDNLKNSAYCNALCEMKERIELIRFELRSITFKKNLSIEN